MGNCLLTMKLLRGSKLSCGFLRGALRSLTTECDNNLYSLEDDHNRPKNTADMTNPVITTKP